MVNNHGSPFTLQWIMEISVPMDKFESAEQYVSSDVTTRLALPRDSDVTVGIGPVHCSDSSDEDSSEEDSNRGSLTLARWWNPLPSPSPLAAVSPLISTSIMAQPLCGAITQPH